MIATVPRSYSTSSSPSDSPSQSNLPSSPDSDIDQNSSKLSPPKRERRDSSPNGPKGSGSRKGQGRPRSTWLLILFFAAFLGTVFIFSATVGSVRHSSLRTPVAALLSRSNPLRSEEREEQQIDEQQITQDNLSQSEQFVPTNELSQEQQPQAPQLSVTREQPQEEQSQSQPVSVTHELPQEQPPQSVQLASTTELSQKQEERLPDLHPPADFPHLCYLQHSAYDVNATDPIYPFNSRSFCLTSSVCLRPSTNTRPAIFYSSAPLSRTTCRNITASFDMNSNQNFDCSHVQDIVYRPHGRFIPPRVPVPPEIRPMSNLTTYDSADAEWLDGVAFVVPAFPHMGNIFHFSYVAGSTAFIASAIPHLLRSWRGKSTNLPDPLPVTILLRGSDTASLGSWQAGVINAVLEHRLRKAGMRVVVRTLNEAVIGDETGSMRSTQLTCFRSAIFLGPRSHINLWPFPSNHWIPVDGSHVPVESIAFRRAVFDAVGVKTRMPSLPAGSLSSPPATALFDLPPKVLAYSRRNTHIDFLRSPKPYQEGTVRRFSDDDEEWFVSMLKSAAQRRNFSYAQLQTEVGVPFEEQVRAYASAGIVAGIHGANLMNSIFAAPFGSLVELFAGPGLQCYIAGANAGLEYNSYYPVRRATGEESGCYPQHNACWRLEHSRRVLISDPKDRSSLTQIINHAVDRIDQLHASFGHLGGIPVKHHRLVSSYVIDWSRARR